MKHLHQDKDKKYARAKCVREKNVRQVRGAQDHFHDIVRPLQDSTANGTDLRSEEQRIQEEEQR